MAEVLKVESVLWSDAEFGGWRPDDGSTQERFVATPSSVDIRQLLPWRASSVIASWRRESDDRSRRSRWRHSLGAAGLLSVGAMSRSRRVGIARRSSLVAQVAASLGVPMATGIVLCGPPRANQKPVIQLHDERGRAIAFVKVAWNDLTHRLLAAEEQSLIRLNGIPDKGFLVPPVLARGVFGTATWLAIGPVTVDHRGRPDLGQVDALASAVERTGNHWDGRTGESSYIARLIDESKGLAAGEPAVARLVERWGDRPITLAGAHGDFVPWNMLSGAPQPAVWDWERYDSAVPVGFDRLHYRAQVGLHRKQQPLDVAIGAIERDLDRILSDLAPPQRRAHLEWYVADLLCRYERDAGDEPTPRLFGMITNLTEILKGI